MNKKGVIVVAFDLPAIEKSDKKAYTKFRNNIKKLGYVFLQESVYVKLVRNTSANGEELKRLESIAPADGKIFALPMSLEDFKRNVYIRGAEFNFAEFSDDIICI